MTKTAEIIPFPYRPMRKPAHKTQDWAAPMRSEAAKLREQAAALAAFWEMIEVEAALFEAELEDAGRGGIK